MSAKRSLLSAVLAAALLAATPAFAQDILGDAVEVDDSVPNQLVGEYGDALFGGNEVAAIEAITALRTGGDFTVATTVTRTATHPDGTTRAETVTVETVVANENGPMGWSEIDDSLGLAQALVEGGQAADVNEALLGDATTTRVVHPDGTTTMRTTYAGGILAMRAGGMGWGRIAKELGFAGIGAIRNGRQDGAGKPGQGVAERF